MNRIWRYVVGYHRVRLKGTRILAFLNGCRNRGIRLYDLERQGSMSVRCRIPQSHMKKLLMWAEESRVEVEDLGYRGVVPLLLRVASRRGMVLGAALLLVAAYVLSQFVWFVDLSGAEPFRGQVLEQLASMGVERGTLWRSLDLDAINNRLMLDNPSLAYLILKRQGVTLKGELYLAVEPEPFVDATRHCDIVADRPAVILEIAAYEGTPKVKAGDVVKEGQVLIEGSFFRNEEEEPRYVSARGKILGRVWYSASATASLEAVRTEPTGNEYTVRTMELGGWEVDLTEEPPPYEEYTVEEVSRTPVVGSFFPAQVITKRYREVTVVTEQGEFTAAEAEAKASAEELALRQVPTHAVVRDTLVRSAVKGSQVEVTVYIEAAVTLGTPVYYE